MPFFFAGAAFFAAFLGAAAFLAAFFLATFLPPLTENYGPRDTLWRQQPHAGALSARIEVNCLVLIFAVAAARNQPLAIAYVLGM